MGVIYKNGVPYTGQIVDNTMSSTSENPVQNKVITEALGNKANANNVYNKTESDARYLQKSGGVLTGDVTTPVTEFTSTSLVTRQFVEDAIAAITDYDEEAF